LSAGVTQELQRQWQRTESEEISGGEMKELLIETTTDCRTLLLLVTLSPSAFHH